MMNKFKIKSNHVNKFFYLKIKLYIFDNEYLSRISNIS
jgi:hypothetical protein